MLDGAVQGADAVRALIGAARQLYDGQDFNFAGLCDGNGFIEDYTTEVRGRPLEPTTSSPSTPTGRPQHIAANYRPLSSLMYFLPPAARKVRRPAIRRALPRWRR